MFIKHFNIHRKIPLHIIQEFYCFLTESQCTREAIYNPHTDSQIKDDRHNTVQTNKVTA